MPSKKTIRLCNELMQATKRLMEHLLLNPEKEEKEESNNEMKQTNITYNAKNKTVIFDAAEEDFDPKYLNYLLEHLNIPPDTKRIFKK